MPLKKRTLDGISFGVGSVAALSGGGLGVTLAVLLPTIVSALTVFYGLISVSLFVPVVAGIYARHPLARTVLTSIGLSVAPTTVLHLTTGGAGIRGFTPVSSGLLFSVVTLLGDAVWRGILSRVATP